MTSKDLFTFMNDHSEMVISTINAAGKPESAVVGFGQTDKLELICGTSKRSRKVNNISGNKNVSIVIGWDQEGTIQYEGQARLLGEEEVDTYTKWYFDKTPEAKKHRSSSDEQYILITPTWMRYTDVSIYPWGITEIRP